MAILITFQGVENPFTSLFPDSKIFRGKGERGMAMGNIFRMLVQGVGGLNEKRTRAHRMDRLLENTLILGVSTFRMLPLYAFSTLML